MSPGPSFKLAVIVAALHTTLVWADDAKEEKAPPDYGELNVVRNYEDPETKTPLIPPIRLFDPYFAAKETLRDRSGLNYIVEYAPISQWGAENAHTNHELNLIGIWNLLDSEPAGKGNVGVWYQHSLTLGDLTTSAFMQSLAVVSPVNGGDTEPDRSANRLQLLVWEHLLFGESLRLMAGKITTRVTLNQNRYAVSDREDFFTPMIVNNTVVPFTARLGLGVFAQFRRERFYLSALVRDADASGALIDFGSLGSGNWEYAAELGLTPDIPGAGDGNYRFTYHYTDAIGEASSFQPAGWSASLSFDQDLGTRVGTFFRYAHANSPFRVFQTRVAAGVQILEPFDFEDDRIGIGYWWADPTKLRRREEHGVEIFWRIQLARLLELTPDLQVIFEPALEPDKDAVAVVGLRLRFVF